MDKKISSKKSYFSCKIGEIIVLCDQHRLGGENNPQSMQDLQNIFDQLKKILQKHDKGPVIGAEELINSQAKEKKPAYVLYGKKEVVIGNKKPQQTYVMGVILQKNFVGFYSMAVYAFSKELKIQNKKLHKALKGKSCFNITSLDSEMMKEIDAHIKKGIELFKEKGWI